MDRHSNRTHRARGPSVDVIGVDAIAGARCAYSVPERRRGQFMLTPTERDEVVSSAQPAPQALPKVSVCVVTYNHAKFIEVCLQSLVDQDTSFPFEVIVSDDASTDGTGELILAFADRYPGIVRAFVQPRNLGATSNYFFVHAVARGDYVAHVDGDDFALPGKLQKLHDGLESNAKVNIVWHRMKILDEHGRQAVGMPLEPHTARTIYGSNRITLDRLLLFYSVGGYHSGSMYRRSARKVFDNGRPTLDYVISLSLCEDGEGLHLDEALGVYRWFASERTVTKEPHNWIVNEALLEILRRYGTEQPQHRKSVVAHATMKALITLYLRNPFWKRYAKLVLDLRTVPRAEDLLFIWRVFDAGRAKRLRHLLDGQDKTTVSATERTARDQ